jgi:acetyl esterase
MALPVAAQRRLLRLLGSTPIRIEGQDLAPEIQLVLRLIEVSGEPRVEDLPLPAGRRHTVRQARLAGGRLPIGAVRDLLVDGGAGALPARLYVPRSRVGADRAPTLLYFHGGGFVYGDIDSHDAACRHLAEHAGVQVLSVDYRLAPEDPFPAAPEDAEASYRWLLEHAAEVGADPDRIAVGGDSAGGNLAAVVALTAARDGLPLAAQLLVYPVTDQSRKHPSRSTFGRGFYLTTDYMDRTSDLYAGPGVDRTDPRLSPVYAELPAGLAPAIVAVAGFDPLRDEGLAYAGKLAAAGVPVELLEYHDMIHGFFNYVGVGRVARRHNREIAARLAAALR